ncbi:MAG: class I SAM-dependent rRNA methyltransferase [Wenzhouxiangella sp.]|nr:MAG: class I SAM-dependent rRNA methyltransferase [Wenzhouxiangella sp.]
MSTHPVLHLKKKEARRLRAGHLWIFSNEVDIARSPLKAMEPGQLADVVDENGKPVGTALVNPHSLICARLISRRGGVNPDQSWLVARLRQALALRERFYERPYYRLVFGEADGLPGLVLDRFGDVLVGQLNTAGMDGLRSRLEAALAEVVRPSAILWRNDSPIRDLEGLKREIVPGPGQLPAEVEVVEGSLKFRLDLMSAQKTGWYFDQQANRARVWPLLAECGRVLDLYAYHGAWGIGAAAQGAAEVFCVDSSAPAVAAIRANADRNGVDRIVRPVHADAEKHMDQCLADGERFDAVIVDPPAFAARARDVKPALNAYRRINQKALRLVRPGGLLVSCSCSAHVHEDRFGDILRQAGRHVDRDLQVLMRLEQGPDHPVHPAIEESRYLKGLVVRVLPSF